MPRKTATPAAAPWARCANTACAPPIQGKLAATALARAPSVVASEVTATTIAVARMTRAGISHRGAKFWRRPRLRTASRGGQATAGRPIGRAAQAGEVRRLHDRRPSGESDRAEQRAALPPASRGRCTGHAETRLRGDRRDRAGARGGGEGGSMLDREERRDGRRSQRQSRQPAAESVARAPGDPERGEDHHGVRINLVSSRFTRRLGG